MERFPSVSPESRARAASPWGVSAFLGNRAESPFSGVKMGAWAQLPPKRQGLGAAVPLRAVPQLTPHMQFADGE